MTDTTIVPKKVGRPTLEVQAKKAVSEAVDNAQSRAQVLAQLVSARYASIGYAQISEANWRDIANCADKIVELSKKG